MQKHPRLKSLSALLIASVATLGISWSYADIIDLSGTHGNHHILGTFFPGGNAGTITFSGLSLDRATDPPKFTGKYIFLETVGWAQLESQTGSLTDTDIDLIEVMSGVTSWPVKGEVYAWSNNAGWLTLHALDNSYSGVSYIPGSSSFSGYAWSDTLGYVDFSTANTIFKNRVKILGNIGGNKAFDTEYNIGNKFNTISTASLFDTIRKNISLMTRSVGDNKINTLGTDRKKLNNDTIFYRLNGDTVSNPGDIMNNISSESRSLIIEGGNVYIDADITKNPQMNKSRAIIVMKDKNGNGGNIYINGGVKNIYATLIAEGTIHSGDNATTLYNDTSAKVLNLPQKQLYINGSVISRNTIGGATQTPPTCPYLEQNCTMTTSIKYDWNYFRTYDKKSGNGSDNKNWEDYSIIIEHDPRIISDPPPGLNN